MNEKLELKIKRLMSGGEGHHHLSPSSLSIPIPKFIINYVMLPQEERRLQIAGYKAHYGNLCNNPVQRLLCSHIFDMGKKIKPKKKDIKTHIEDEWELVQKYPTKDDRDAACRAGIKEFIEPTTKQIITAIKEIFGDQELIAERYVHTNPKGLIFDLLGRIDYESQDTIVELKTKPVNFRATKKGLSSYIQKLPQEEADENHLKQLAFYYKATGKTPYLVYANSESFKIFKPEIPQLEYYYDQMVNKAFIIQNLLEVTEGNLDKLSQLVEPPDFKSFYYSDLTSSQLEKTKQLWRL